MRTVLFIALFASFASAQTITHVEETDPAVTYSGAWYTNNSAANSNGLTNLTNTKDSQAALTFTGTGITWIGVLDSFCGVAWVYLDGTLTTVDTWSDTTSYQQKLFSVHNLAPGQHTIVIDVPHIRHLAGKGSWVWIDAFDIENGGPVLGGTSASAGRVEETNPALKYVGKWYPNISAVHSNGSAMIGEDDAASVSVTFNGTSIIWLTFRDQYSGIAKVYLDGALKTTFDEYQATAQAEYPAYAVGGLPPGMHTLTIQSTGTSNPLSGGTAVWVDAFQIIGSLVLPGAPTMNAGGVVNAATYITHLAPGQIVSIFGSNFLGSGRADASTLPLPTQLGPDSLTVNACGQNIPIFSIFPGQINAQLPFECASTGTSQMIVTVAGQSGVAQTINLAAAAPGIFTVNTTGTGDGAILHADNTLVSATSPATAGEQVVIYTTGLGPTTPAVATGAAATQTNRTINPVTVTIGGQNATVTYAGLAVGYAGLYQINAIVPSVSAGSQAVTVTVASTNQSAPGVTMSVH